MDSNEVAIEVQRADGTVTVRVGGELDLATAPRLRDVFAGLAQDTSPRRVGLDLAATTFLDSLGLSVIVQALTRFRSQGSNLVLLATSPQVQRVLEVAGVMELFEPPDESA
jgi:anti-sigma B factor antagonist